MSTVEIIYPTIEQQQSFFVNYSDGLTINDVIIQSGILNRFPEIDLAINQVGIYNQAKALTDSVKPGDRVEIYRPLLANPKEVRRKRAVKQKEAGIIK